MDIRTDINFIGEWTAIDADTYDVDCDQDGFFSTSPVGYGKTKQQAIDDLLEQIDPDGLIEGSPAWREANGQFGVGA